MRSRIQRVRSRFWILQRGLSKGGRLSTLGFCGDGGVGFHLSAFGFGRVGRGCCKPHQVVVIRDVGTCPR